MTKPFPAIPKICSPQQRKYLRDRLSNTREPAAHRSWRDHSKDPKEVREARKTIERYETEQRREDNKRSAVYEKAREAAKSAILFKTPDVALEAVEAYEKLCADSTRS